ncbi:hypothetical protein FACS189419_03130 [Planctomycetales bacterium]|nr:hypothetical protein FACS189419_03130 [Planctomycetales bacterium]
MRQISTVIIFMLCIFGSVLAEDANVQDRESRIRLPKTDIHGREVASYIEDVPDADYKHASEAASVESVPRLGNATLRKPTVKCR